MNCLPGCLKCFPWTHMIFKDVCSVPKSHCRAPCQDFGTSTVGDALPHPFIARCTATPDCCCLPLPGPRGCGCSLEWLMQATLGVCVVLHCCFEQGNCCFVVSSLFARRLALWWSRHLLFYTADCWCCGSRIAPFGAPNGCGAGGSWLIALWARRSCTSVVSGTELCSKATDGCGWSIGRCR